ncbi:MAG: DUF4249 domain-containing protein [Saprospiraceae bacterium]
MNQIKIFIALILLTGFSSCEEEIVQDNSDYEPQYVVESYLENANSAFPPYLLLTKSLGFYSKFDTSILNKLFVSNAKVSITLNQQKYPLQEICLSQLPPETRKEILKNLGQNSDSVVVDFCAYIDVNGAIPLLVGQSYSLEIIAGLDTIRSATNIPEYISLDSFWFEDIPKVPNLGYVQLYCIINDKADRKDYYRYFTASQDEVLIPNFSSVVNDFFFDGKKFKFTLSKAESGDISFDDYSGYFKRGDSIRIKWCTIAPEQYNFWNTLEVSRTRQGPFSSYVRIQGNIKNGLGIFGGQNCQTYTMYVPKM